LYGGVFREIRGDQNRNNKFNDPGAKCPVLCSGRPKGKEQKRHHKREENKKYSYHTNLVSITAPLPEAMIDSY
jgi:hypothetical protein